MKIFLGADHNGFDLKALISDHLKRSGYAVIDEGDTLLKPDDDFPQFAEKVAKAVLANDELDTYGILVCASGQGMVMAANRYKGIRASLCWDLEEARAARNDDDSNILCLPARVLKTDDAIAIIQCWLNTPFAGAPRFKRRLQELDQMGN